ncbi:MAG: GNAT family N-acetyltransferase [Deltaproteobacteria bacterium]
MKYVLKMIGDKCGLALIDLDDAALYSSWLSDLEVSVFLTAASQQLPIEREVEYLTDAARNGEHVFGIIDTVRDKLIGNCGLVNVDHVHRRADMGIFIGEKGYWGLGYGQEAVKLLLDYGFNVLNLHNIELRVVSYNVRAISCYKKCGFKESGRRRESWVMGGNAYDQIYMDILATEFESIYIKKLMP